MTFGRAQRKRIEGRRETYGAEKMNAIVFLTQDQKFDGVSIDIRAMLHTNIIGGR